MIKGLKKTLIHSIGIFVCLAASIFWWRMWIHQGFIGPVPILHWFIKSDGELSCDLTQYEIIIQLFVIYVILLLVKHFIFGKQKDVDCYKSL